MKKSFRKYLVLTITLGIVLALSGCIIYEKRVSTPTEDTDVSELELYLQSYDGGSKEQREDGKKGISKKEKNSLPKVIIKDEDTLKEGKIIVYSSKKDNIKIVKKEKEDVIKGSGLPKIIAKSGQYIDINFTKYNQECIGICLLDGDKAVDLDERLFESIGKTTEKIKVPDRKGNYILYIFSGWKNEYVIYGINLISK